MTLPKNRSELVQRLEDAAAKLVAEFDRLPMDARVADEDGVSPADRLAFQIGWGQLLLGWHAAELRGEHVAMPAPGYKWNQQRQLAESFYKECEHASIDELLGLFRETVEGIQEFIAELTDAELFENGHFEWAGEKWPIVKWIQVNTMAPYTSARTAIRRQIRQAESNS